MGSSSPAKRDPRSETTDAFPSQGCLIVSLHGRKLTGYKAYLGSQRSNRTGSVTESQIAKAFVSLKAPSQCSPNGTSGLPDSAPAVSVYKCVKSGE
jgi:hypothetical protein